MLPNQIDQIANIDYYKNAPFPPFEFEMAPKERKKQNGKAHHNQNIDLADA